MSNNRRPGQIGYGSNQQTVYETVYQDPLVASTYDPDGLQGLFDQDEIDWDDSSIWDSWNWVTHGEVDEDVAGPAWADMDHRDRVEWFNDNRDSVEDLFEGRPVSDFTMFSDDSPLATHYNNIRNQGAFGGTDIDYSYYQNDPLYQMAFANIDWDAQDSLDAPNWNTPGEGVTQEHLQLATMHIVDTYRAIRDDAYRNPWDGEMPDPITPVAMTTDYETPFDIPGIVKQLPSPVMSSNLQKVKARSGSNKEAQWNELKANTPNQQGFVDPNAESADDET
ncbi:MAG TPA: hypothetical protein QGH16_10700 [Verrucomicrobiota bacterium]|nr:hypothetical protein [Verrucomicrobiota bacterium]